MKILKLVDKCRTIGISGHENPDGDCVGSCMGMALFLRKALPDAQIDVFLEKPPAELERNIPGSEAIRHDFRSDISRYDAFIVLDSTGERTAGARKMYESAALRINIDHHISNPGTGDVNYIDGQASSACELVYRVIDTSMIDRDIAQALYVGIVTDTGVFQYSNTGQSTMRAAGDLMKYGFDFSAIIREVFFERTFKQARALGAAFTAMESRLDGRYVRCALSIETQRNMGLVRADLEEISSQMVLTAGADCAIFVHEDAPDLWRGSFRSNKIVDVARIAVMFGGGGHIRASGCTIYTQDRSIGEVLAQIEADIAAQESSYVSRNA